MKTKHHILVTKKKQPRRTVRFFSFVRKARPFSLDRPLAITIGTDGLTEEQIDLLKELESKGRLPKITWIASSPNGFDDVMKFALLYLHSDEACAQGVRNSVLLVDGGGNFCPVPIRQGGRWRRLGAPLGFQRCD